MNENTKEQNGQRTKNTSRHRTDVLLVILFLGLIGLAGVGGCIFLIYNKASDGSLVGLVGLVGPAIGGLASLLTSTRQHETPAGTPGDPVVTTNANPPGDPVLVTTETPAEPPVPAGAAVVAQEGQETP